MARLIPNVDLEAISNKPERDVARAMVSMLPENVMVYHSYPWLKAEHNGTNRKVTLNEGEADFVVVVPEIGFLVLEIKGGHIKYENENRRWFRQLPSGEQRNIKDPFEQARVNTHVLKDKIIQYSFPGAKLPPCAFGYLVIFPDCDYNGTPPPGSESAIILSAKDLPHLGQRIPSALRKWCHAKSPKPMTEEQLAGLKSALNSTFRLVPLLSRQIEEEEERLVRLTEEQARLLDFLTHHNRCGIEGVAGSGKTLLAFEQAGRFAQRRLKTLFVCYNRALADWIRSNLSDSVIDHLHVYHFHGLCSDICRLAKLPFKPPTEDIDKFFRNQAPSLLLDAIERIGPQYDAMVVDEGQDFDPEWWLPLELLCKDGEAAPFFLFYDPAQNLFVDDPGLPDLGKPYPLSINCRNTRRIAKLCSLIRDTEIETHDRAPEGRKVGSHLCLEADQQVNKCHNILKDFKKNGVRADQIVIQSPFRKESFASSFKSKSKIGGYHIVTDINKWRSGKGILFTTIRRFKGLEADVVIMVDLPAFDESPVFTVNDYYVGVSRAKHVLEILVKSKDDILQAGN